jgi:hypothetical protein
MKNIITLSIVALILSIFSAQYAMANNLALDETLGVAVEAATNEAKAEARAAADDIKVNGGYVRIGRDKSVSIVSDGPTIGQRIYLAGAYVKDGILYVTYKTYDGAKAADGAVMGTVTYPFAKIGEWLNTPKTEVAAVTPAPAAPATK